MQNFIWHSLQFLGSLFSPPLAKWISKFALLWKLWLHLSHWYGLFLVFFCNFSSILGISIEYHGRFMVQWNARKSLSNISNVFHIYLLQRLQKQCNILKCLFKIYESFRTAISAAIICSALIKPLWFQFLAYFIGEMFFSKDNKLLRPPIFANILQSKCTEKCSRTIKCFRKIQRSDEQHM